MPICTSSHIFLNLAKSYYHVIDISCKKLVELSVGWFRRRKKYYWFPCAAHPLY
jgi:hypothetical protein